MKVDFRFDVGEEVNDLLTGQKRKVIGLNYLYGRQGNNQHTRHDSVAYFIDDPHINGSRFEFEISKITEEQKEYDKYIDEYQEFWEHMKTNGL